MGMRSGKVLKAAKRTVKKAPKLKAAKAKRATAKAAAPKVVTKIVEKVVTKTVEVDPNRALRQLAQRIVDATIANDDEGMYALYAEGVESKEASNPASVGIEALRQKFAMWRSMISDATFTPRTVVADGKTIVIEWSGRVTLAASGRLVDLDEVAVHEIAGGKIVRERFYYDPSLLQG
jgi:ketosteroid isomerase-like protein